MGLEESDVRLLIAPFHTPAPLRNSQSQGCDTEIEHASGASTCDSIAARSNSTLLAVPNDTIKHGHWDR